MHTAASLSPSARSLISWVCLTSKIPAGIPITKMRRAKILPTILARERGGEGGVVITGGIMDASNVSGVGGGGGLVGSGGGESGPLSNKGGGGGGGVCGGPPLGSTFGWTGSSGMVYAFLKITIPLNMDPIPSMKRRKVIVKSPATGTPESVAGRDVLGVAVGATVGCPVGLAVGVGVGVGLGVGVVPPSDLGEGDGVPVWAEGEETNSRSDLKPEVPFGVGEGVLISILDFGDVSSPVPEDWVFRKSCV